MRRILTLFVLATLILGLNTYAFAGPRRAVRRSPAQCRPNLASCPLQGCGGRGTDPLLNEQKNRTDSASSPEDITITDIKRKSQPRRWPVGQARNSIQGPGKEGSEVRLMTFMKRVTQSGAESCNCGLTGPGNTDLHITLVSRLTGPQSVNAAGVTAEVTPRVVAQDHPEWKRANIQRFAVGKFVRITGYMMLDTQHISRPLVRATNWEIHPITNIEVCTARISDCRAGTGWKTIAQLVP